MSAQLAQALKSTLRIDYENDTGPSDEEFWEWWSVIDEATGETLCKCDDEATAKRILAALAAFEAAPQQAQAPGWQLVPVEPTPEMLKGARNAPLPAVMLDSFSAREDLSTKAKWSAMLQAAPQQGSNT